MSITIPDDRRRYAQILLCQGGACGNAAKGRCPVPIERLRACWKEAVITPQISLAVTSCLGPCSVANLAVILHAEGSVWLGDLEDADYDALAVWAADCRDGLVPLPERLVSKQCERWRKADDNSFAMGLQK